MTSDDTLRPRSAPSTLERHVEGERRAAELRRLCDSLYGPDSRRAVEAFVRARLEARAATAWCDVASVELCWPTPDRCMALAELTFEDDLDTGRTWLLAQVDIDDVLSARSEADVEAAFHGVEIGAEAAALVLAWATQAAERARAVA